MKSLTQFINENNNKENKILLDTYNSEDDNIDVYIEDFIENLDKVNKEYEGFVITGSLGLWHGKKDIYPEYYRDLTEAYQKIVEKSDDVIVELENGALKVTAMHHDGRNTLYIRPLSKEGSEIMYSFTQGYEEDYFENITDDEFYKKFTKDNKMILSFDEKYF